MSQKISLREAEQRVFRTTFSDGLVDLFLGCFFLIFVFGPYLSPTLGDFWASVAFLPFWALVCAALALVRKYLVTPRIGVVRFGHARKVRLTRFSAVMLAINVVALILGTVAALSYKSVPGPMISIVFGMLLLIGLSTAAYFLDFNRLYMYGLLVGLSPLVGEWLWTRGYAAHHGFPITFGASAGIMILVGLASLLRLLHDNPVPAEGSRSEEA